MHIPRYNKYFKNDINLLPKLPFYLDLDLRLLELRERDQDLLRLR